MYGTARRLGVAALVLIGLGPSLMALVVAAPAAAEPWPTTAPSCSTSYPVGTSPPLILSSVDVVSPVAFGQVHVQGWVVDQEAPQRTMWLRAWTDRGFDKVMAANGVRPDVAAAVPGAGAEHGFDLVIDVPEGTGVFALQTYRERPEQSVVLTWCTATVPRQPPVGFLDDVSSPAPGALRVQGWAIDPSTPAEAVEVHVYVGDRGVSIGAAARSRPDVAALSPLLGPAHGFDRVLTGIPPGPQQVCVYGINRGQPAPNPQLGCRTVQVADRPAGAPIGSVDVLGVPGTNGVRAAGWAIDPDQPAQPVRIQLAVGGPPGVGRTVDVGAAEGGRPDVAQAYASIGAGERHGFDASVGTVPAGPTEVCVLALDDAGVHHSLLSCGVVDVPPSPGDPIGQVDAVSSPAAGQIAVQGWALQRSAPTAGVPVQAYVDGPAGVGSGFDLGPATSPRPDVATAHADVGAGAAHGFAATLSGISAGTHQVCVYVLGQGAAAGATPLLDCRTVPVS
jgi:hypothetical protein